jgi:hypothetical protein
MTCWLLRTTTYGWLATAASAVCHVAALSALASLFGLLVVAALSLLPSYCTAASS